MDTQSSNTHISPRPTVPPKPKSGGKGDPGRTNVGTQVNLLRKSLPGTRPEKIVAEGEVCGSSPSQVLRLSSGKPALPPKPASNSLSAPPRRASVPTPPKTKEKEKKAAAPRASIEELDNLSDLNSPPAAVLSPRAKGLPVFQYPAPFLSPTQRAEALRKSTSLGRNTNFSPFVGMKKSSTLSRVSPLDLPPARSLGLHSVPFTLPTDASPPPPPPRVRRKPSTGLGLQLPSPTSPPLSGPSSPQSAPVLPLYAVVDKEKKWEERRLKMEAETMKIEEEMKVGEVVAGTEAVTSSEPITGTESGMTAEPAESLAEGLPKEAEPSSWLGKYIERAEDEDKVEGELRGKEPVTPDPQTRQRPLSIIESFLFQNVVVLTEEPKEPEAGTNHSVVDVEAEEVFDEVLTEEPKEPETGTNHSVVDVEAEEVFEEVQAEASTSLPELKEYEIMGLAESPRQKNGHRSPEVEDGFESLLEAKLEGRSNGTLVLDGVTTSSSSTDKVSPTNSSDAELIHEIIRSQEQFKSPSRRAGSAEAVDNTCPSDPDPVPTGPVPLKGPEPFRRRSWNCSEHTSSFSESSPSSSSSSSLRDRTSSVCGSLQSQSTWVDEGEISTGALGDAENSDTTPAPEGAGSPAIPGPGGSFSRRRRLVNSIFSSFGKAGEGSSSSGGSLLRSQQPPIRRKDKSRSNFFLENTKSAPGKTKKIKSEAYLSTRPIVAEGPKTQSLPPVAAAAAVESEPEAGSISPRVYDEILRELSDKGKQAFFVAREILTSERTFVDVLNLLTIEFPAALKAALEVSTSGQPIIAKADLDLILGGLPILKGVNQVLLNDLEDRIRSWRSNPKVSDIIVKTGPFLKHYSTYIRDFQKISQHFDLCRHKNMKFSKVVADFESTDRCKHLGLKHYMLKPVQRMPQYALLLSSYLKNLEPESEDYEDTVKAITIVRDVAEHGNEAIRLQKNAEKLVQLQSRLTQNVILKADRQLICEGELQKVCRKELQSRYFALMSDCLLCLNYAGTGGPGVTKEFRLRYELPLAGMRVALAPSEDYQNEFSVISITRSFNLVAKSAREREDWMKALDLAIRNNIRKRTTCSTPEMEREFQVGKVAPVWIADSRVTMCQACTAEFKMTFRRHHCRACGKVVCGNCSGSEAPLQYQNNDANRVCNDCYEYLLEEFDKENQEKSGEEVELVRSRFKKGTPSISKKAAKHKKSIPQRLEVHANSSDSAMCGYLQWREHRKAWKKQWFKIVEQVLYVYAASEDVAATKSIPILGYQVEALTLESPDGVDGRTMFQLTHSGQDPYVFQAESSASAEKWMTAMKEATVLK